MERWSSTPGSRSRSIYGRSNTTRSRPWPPRERIIDLGAAGAYVLIRQRMDHRAGMRFLDGLHNTGRLLVVRSDAPIESDAEAILRQYSDQDFSYADAVSFAVMRRRGIGDAFGFDHHFRTAGFALLPAAAQ